MTTPAVARPSATILLLRDDPFEVLMVRRSAAGPFPSALVFPGGTVDADDHNEAWLPLTSCAERLSTEERATRIAALRETFEEVGLLLVDGGAAPRVCEGDFRAIVTASGGRLALDAIVPFARWITPEREPRRWDTHFFLARAPRDQTPVCDDVETMSPEWIGPADALTLPLLFPTRLNLMRLAESASCDQAIAAARTRPMITVRPRIEERADGLYSVIDSSAGYVVTEQLLRPRVSRPDA